MRGRWIVAFCLVGSLGLLLLHAWAYRFDTDDAYISFRYARNLAQGHGLVFNPGFERVEGYTDFLWVVLLAGFDRMGIAPELSSRALSLASTLALWGLVAWYALRNPPGPGRQGLLLVPALFLAATRTVAVWSTGGLETRFFEALILAGALRLVVEVKARIDGLPRRPIAAWLFALAALTRPDGLLLSVSAFVAASLYLARRRCLSASFLAGLLPFGVLVGGHLLFRWVYYGDWVPNTYYAKVGGRSWWSAGLPYLAAFVLEYAAYLWVPLLAAGVVLHVRRGTSFVPVLFSSLILPHALYVASIGGDLFEYRPLDLYVPFLFLLLYDGCRHLATGRAAALATAVYCGVCLVGIWEIPHRSHQEFPGHYLPSFPGLTPDSIEDAACARSFLAPERDPIYRLAGLRSIAGLHQRLIRSLSLSAVGLRQEEHRLFVATVVPEGHELRKLVERRLLPAETHVALPCVGAIPYYSDLRTLDRLGLTDQHVAHSPGRNRRVMAHDKAATLEYAQERGVDLWSVVSGHLLLDVTSRSFLAEVGRTLATEQPVYAAEVGGNEYLVGILPQGIEQASRKMPALRFLPLNDPRFVRRLVEQGVGACREALRQDPQDREARRQLADLLLLGGDFASVIDVVRETVRIAPDDLPSWELLGLGQERIGDREGAIASLGRALELASAQGDEPRRRRLEGRVGLLSLPNPGARAPSIRRDP